MQQNQDSSGKRRNIWVVMAVFVFVAGVVLALFVSAPKGFDMNLAKIGTGKPALVFVYDSNVSVSLEQASVMSQVRDSLDREVYFLVAHTEHPDAIAFMKRHGVESLELLYFNASGELQKRAPAFLNVQELTQFIQTVKP